jgi:hypothetical protein
MELTGENRLHSLPGSEPKGLVLTIPEWLSDTPVQPCYAYHQNPRAMLFLGKKTPLLSVLLAVMSFGDAQTTDSCAQRSLVANVRNQEGKLVPGLHPASFRALLGHQPVRVLSDRVNTEAPRIVLLVDLSTAV